MKNPLIAIICALPIAQAVWCQTQNSSILTVQTLQAIDSTKAASGTQFTGKTVTAVTSPRG